MKTTKAHAINTPYHIHLLSFCVRTFLFYTKWKQIIWCSNKLTRKKKYIFQILSKFPQQLKKKKTNWKTRQFSVEQIILVIWNVYGVRCDKQQQQQTYIIIIFKIELHLAFTIHS